MATAKFCICGRGIMSGGNCAACGRNERYKPKPKTTKQRGYGWDWQQLSARYRTNNPLCEDCLQSGKVVPADEVHHIQPIADAPHLRLAIENLVAVCKDCHRRRHDTHGDHGTETMANARQR